jgi:hypothetical protein
MYNFLLTLINLMITTAVQLILMHDAINGELSFSHDLTMKR